MGIVFDSPFTQYNTVTNNIGHVYNAMVHTPDNIGQDKYTITLNSNGGPLH